MNPGQFAAMVAEDIATLVRVRSAYDQLIIAIDRLVAADPERYGSLVADLRGAMTLPTPAPPTP